MEETIIISGTQISIWLNIQNGEGLQERYDRKNPEWSILKIGSFHDLNFEDWGWDLKFIGTQKVINGFASWNCFEH